jgi:hypothetical protein
MLERAPSANRKVCVCVAVVGSATPFAQPVSLYNALGTVFPSTKQPTTNHLPTRARDINDERSGVAFRSQSRQRLA